MEQPSVSVIIANTSDEMLLAKALVSVRAQTFPASEILTSAAGLAEAESWNRGIRQASSKFVAFLDARHQWCATKLEKQMERLSGNPSLNWCFCGSYDQPGWNPAFASGFVLRDLLLNNFIPTSSVIARRSSLEEAGGFSQSAHLSLSADWDLWLRLAAVHPVGYVAEPLLYTPSAIKDIEALFISRKCVIEEAIARHSQLKDLRSEALTEICIRAGNAYLAAGRATEAREKFSEALTHHPLRSDAYLSWASSFLPLDAQQQVRDLHNLGRHLQGKKTRTAQPAGKH